MIGKSIIKRFCSEDISLIENYEKAISDTEMWDCHHRLEIQGNKIVSRKELIEQNLYYHRPASELIFLPMQEHHRIHSQNRKLESNQRISECMKNRKLSKETKQKISESVKEYQKTHPITEEQHKQMSYMQQNMKFFNNGVVSTKALSCPEGFVPGRLKYDSKGNAGMHWYTNGTVQIQCYEQDCPEGFRPGKLPYSKEHNKHLSEGKKKALQNPDYIKKLSESIKGRKRYTNGVDNIMSYGPCPEGWWPGMTRNKR